MDIEKLEILDRFLRESFSDYLSMIAVGSIVTGDPAELLKEIENIITPFEFDDSYIFTSLDKNNWGVPCSKYCFSNAFRSKTLFGEDFVKLARLPPKAEVRKIYLEGLRDIFCNINDSLANLGSWSVEKVRDKFWKQFKHAFMYLAIREFFLTGDYPKTRKEISERLGSCEIRNMFDVLHSIDSRSKEEIINCAKSLVVYLESKVLSS